MGAERERFIVLDGMRGLAAFAVITDHVHSPWFDAALPGRYLAVDFFFVLSGFVLSHVYSRRLAAGMTAWAFMRARLIRLYPLYLVGTLAGASLAVLLVLRGWSETAWSNIGAAGALSLVMAPTPAGWSPSAYNIYPFDGPAWSLFFELVANAVFGVFFLKLSQKVLLTMIAVGAAGLVVAAIAYGPLVGGYNWHNFVVGFPRVMFGFFAGVLVHRLHLAHPLPALPAWAAMPALIALFAVPAVGVWRTLFDVFAVAVLCPALVAVSAGAQLGGLAARASAFLGLASFGIYILHVPMRDWLDMLLVTFAPNFSPPGAAMVALVAVLSLIITLLLHHFYDVPMRRWLSAHAAGRRLSV